MATRLATPTEQVFVSRHTNLSVTRFAELKDPLPGGGSRPIAPGLRYAFGHDSGVKDKEGFDIPVGGSVRVDDKLRARDRQYIAQYGKHYPPETDADPYDPDTDSKQDYLKRAFLSTEDFLRQRAELTGNFREIEPVAPGSQDALRKITDLSIDRDVDGLVALHNAEQEEWAREDVLEAVVHALERLAEEEQPQPAA